MATRKKKAEAPVYAFPLAEGGYFSTPATARRSTSSGSHVAALQQRLGLAQTNQFDNDLRGAVMQWQQDNDIVVTGVVDKETWDSLML